MKRADSAPDTGFAVGWYGKIPATGDFIARRVSASFRDPWDRWLQRAIAGSQQRLGAGWRDAFLSMPAWRFVLGPGSHSDSGAAFEVLDPDVGIASDRIDDLARDPLAVAGEPRPVLSFAPAPVPMLLAIPTDRREPCAEGRRRRHGHEHVRGRRQHRRVIRRDGAYGEVDRVRISQQDGPRRIDDPGLETAIGCGE